MQYKTNTNRRSRLADVGAGSLTHSFVQSYPRQNQYDKLPFELDPEEVEMPVYSAFKTRKRGDPLRDFQIEIEDRSTRNNYIQRRRT